MQSFGVIDGARPVEAWVQQLVGRGPAGGRAAGVWWVVLLVVAWLAGAGQARAWGESGHRLIADMAQARLSAAAQQRLQVLLALEGADSLADLATWADQHRNPTTAPWHYVNFPRDSCHYQPERDCAQGACVVAAMERQSQMVAQATDPQAQLQALKYLVHLLADVHQPLHAGYRDDRGGNGYQLQAFMVGSNLHALWDTLMIRHLDETSGWRSALMERNRVADEDQPWTAAGVAEESCRLVASPGLYPDRRVGLEYLQQFAPLLEQRLLRAAQRTAEVLNRLLSVPP